MTLRKVKVVMSCLNGEISCRATGISDCNVEHAFALFGEPDGDDSFKGYLKGSDRWMNWMS